MSLNVGYVLRLQNMALRQGWWDRDVRGAFTKDLGPSVMHGWPYWQPSLQPRPSPQRPSSEGLRIKFLLWNLRMGAPGAAQAGQGLSMAGRTCFPRHSCPLRGLCGPSVPRRRAEGEPSLGGTSRPSPLSNEHKVCPLYFP